MKKFYYFNEAAMEDSFIYKTFNNANNILEVIISAIQNGNVLDKTYIEEQYIQLKRTTFSPLSRNVLDAFERGDIELVFNVTEKVPMSIPFIVRRKGNRIISTIFLSTFCSLNKDGTSVNIPSKNLYVLMESAYIALRMQSDSYRLMKNTALMKLCNSIYTEMVMRILNRDYALTLDKTLYNQVTFSVSKFFTTQIWGQNNQEIVTSYAISLCIDPNMVDIESVNNSFNDRKIRDISDLVDFIKTLSPRLNNITIKHFMERYINTYNPSAVLSIDYLPYLFFVISNTLLGAFIVSQNSLSDIVKDTKGINVYYQELSRLF